MRTALDLLNDYDASVGVTSEPPTVPGETDFLAGVLPAAGLALGSVAVVEVAANRLRRTYDLAIRPVRLRPECVAASFAGDRMLRVDGAPVDAFAALSGFFATRDGWVRTHANYPHHRRRILAALDLPAETDRDAFARALATREAQKVEDLAVASDAIAVRVRDERQWHESAPGLASREAALVDVRRHDVGESVPRAAPTVDRPLAGVRVLDLTRVIAGPVATRTLALLGADVLRIDPTDIGEIPAQHLDTGQGKRTTRLNLRDDAGLSTCVALLAEADVVVTGYRPGSVERLGLEQLIRRPGLIHARVSAWGLAGPWAGRRGFDSIVQAASGIALIEGRDRPGALAAQVLDHASGYLLAAATIDALGERALTGHGAAVSVSLARTAAWLLDRSERSSDPPEAPLPSPESTTITHGRVTTARPALAGGDDYPAPARPWGADEPRWP